MARWFPHLTKLLSPPPPKITETRRTESQPRASTGRPANSPTEPRELPENALSSRRASKTSAPRPSEDRDQTAAAPPPPVLPVSLVTENEPDAPPREGKPSSLPPRSRPVPSSSFYNSPALAHISVRRMPPVPVVNPSTEEKPSPGRRSTPHDEDSQARLARAAEEDVPPPEPLLSVSRSQPPIGPLRRPVEREEPKDKEADNVVQARDEPVQARDEAVPPPADPFAEPPAARPSPKKSEGPPPLDDPSPPQASREPKSKGRANDRPKEPLQARRERANSTDPDTAGDPVLNGRRRLNQGQLSVSREDLQEDVPTASFPRTYYARNAQGKGGDAPSSTPTRNKLRTENGGPACSSAPGRRARTREELNSDCSVEGTHLCRMGQTPAGRRNPPRAERAAGSPPCGRLNQPTP